MSESIADLIASLTTRPFCHAKVRTERCEIPPTWKVTIRCDTCGRGGGDCCEVHRRELEHRPTHKACGGGRIHYLGAEAL